MKKYFRTVLVIVSVFFCAVAFGNVQNEDYYKIAQKMGYVNVKKQPLEITDVLIPEKFGAVYLRYNELLKESGYDLLPYRGKQCRRYTYNIPYENARLNVLVYKGKVIGGDISGITIDGIMIPIIKE